MVIQNLKKQQPTSTVSSTKQWDETFRMLSWWQADKVANARVMVVGAGALGNEVLKNLALLNVGHILIVDFDTIEYANLCRSILFREEDCGAKKAEIAAQRLRSINPNINVQWLDGDISMDVGLGVFRRIDVIISCLDNRIARLYINRHCYQVGKTWIDGAIENLSGQLDVYEPGISCYECQLTEKEIEIIRYREGCADIAARNANFGRIPTTPITSSIIGAMQVQEALKIIHGHEAKTLAGRRFKYEGMNNLVLQPNAPAPIENCLSHSFLEKIEEVSFLSANTTIKDTLNWLKKRLSCPNPVIHLGYALVLEITTMVSEIVYPVVLPKWRMSDSQLHQYRKIKGERIGITRQIDQIDRTFPHQHLTLNNIGIPPLHIISVETAEDIFFFELTGDAEASDW